MIHLRKVSEVKLTPGCVLAENLADGAVDLTTAKVTGELPAVKLADNAIDSTKIADGAIDLSSSKVVGTLPDTKLADGAVKVSKIDNGAVNANKIADGAVDLTTAKVVGELPNSKLAAVALDSTKLTGELPNEKLAALPLTSSKLTGELPNSKLAIIGDVNKLQDGIVTLSKTSDDVKLIPFVAGEEEDFQMGIVEKDYVETGMTKVTGRFEPKKIRIIASLKSSDVDNIAYLKIYADSEVTPRLTLETNNITYTLVAGEFNASDLSFGKHNLKATLSNSEVDGIATSDLIEIYVVK